MKILLKLLNLSWRGYNLIVLFILIFLALSGNYYITTGIYNNIKYSSGNVNWGVGRAKIESIYLNGDDECWSISPNFTCIGIYNEIRSDTYHPLVNCVNKEYGQKVVTDLTAQMKSPQLSGAIKCYYEEESEGNAFLDIQETNISFKYLISLFIVGIAWDTFLIATFISFRKKQLFYKFTDEEIELAHDKNKILPKKIIAIALTLLFSLTIIKFIFFLIFSDFIHVVFT